MRRLRMILPPLLCTLLLGAAALGPARASAQLSDLGLPFDRLAGQVGQWVRYRAGQPEGAVQYLRLAVVGAQEGELWIEISVSHKAAVGAPGLATRMLVARGPQGGLTTRRTILSFNGSAPVEVLPGPAQAAEREPPGLPAGGMPVCRVGGGHCPAGSVRFRHLPREARMSPLGSISVEPLEIITGEGAVIRYELSDRIPLTGLLAADTPLGGRLELDASGEGAVPTVGQPVKKVAQAGLASALTSATPALSALGRMGMLLDPATRQAARASADRPAPLRPPAPPAPVTKGHTP